MRKNAASYEKSSNLSFSKTYYLFLKILFVGRVKNEEEFSINERFKNTHFPMFCKQLSTRYPLFR